MSSTPIPMSRLSDEAILSRPSVSLWTDAWYRLIRNKAAVMGMVIVVIFILVAALAPWLAPHDPLKINDGKGYLPPPWVPQSMSTTGKVGDPRFCLGTDSIGRDVLSRVLYGARVSIVVAFVPTAIIEVIGIIVGLAAGYAGGKWDNLLMRITDVVWGFPDLLFFIVVM